MATEDELWETDEESDVVVKLSGVIRDEFIKNLSSGSKPKCSALGLATEEPLIQLGTDLFKGGYSHACGTQLLLKSNQDGNAGELVFLTTTDQEMNMNKLYVQEKSNLEKNSEEAPDVEVAMDISADMTSALHEKLPE